jgi:hypothetical protein
VLSEDLKERAIERYPERVERRMKTLYGRLSEKDRRRYGAAGQPVLPRDHQGMLKLGARCQSGLCDASKVVPTTAAQASYPYMLPEYEPRRRGSMQ